MTTSKPPNITDEFWQLCIDQRQTLMLKYIRLGKGGYSYQPAGRNAA
jgi:hypothetical protein